MGMNISKIISSGLNSYNKPLEINYYENSTDYSM